MDNTDNKICSECGKPLSLEFIWHGVNICEECLENYETEPEDDISYNGD